MKTKLFNPFVYLAGGKALLLGLVAMALSAVIGYFAHAHFDGVIDFHKFGNTPALPLYVSFAEQAIILICTILPFYASGKIMSKSDIRLIDVAGTMTLARWPLVFSALLGFVIKAGIPKAEDITVGFLALGFAVVLFSIWMIALMYNAFSVSCNIRGSKCAIAFIISLIVAEVASHMLCHQMYAQFQ